MPSIKLLGFTLLFYMLNNFVLGYMFYDYGYEKAQKRYRAEITEETDKKFGILEAKNDVESSIVGVPDTTRRLHNGTF